MRERSLASLDRMTQEEALQLLPPSMASMRKLPIPFSYAFQDNDVEKEMRSSKRRRAARQRQVRDELNSILSNLNAGDGIPDDESYCPSDEYSRDESMDDPDDEEWDDESLLDTGDDAIDPEAIEELLDVDTSGSACRDIKLCSFVKDTVSDAAKRSQIATGNSALEDYKLSRDKLVQHLRDLLDGKGGPNESLKSKLEQLKMQEDVHKDKEFAAGKMQNCLLSHYLLFTRPQRLVSILIAN